MEKRIANKDITYCANKSCKQRKKCFRNLDNYIYNKEDNYWFMDFSEEYCNKGYRKEEKRNK